MPVILSSPVRHHRPDPSPEKNHRRWQRIASDRLRAWNLSQALPAQMRGVRNLLGGFRRPRAAFRPTSDVILLHHEALDAGLATTFVLHLFSSKSTEMKPMCKAVDLALAGDTKEMLMSERNTETGRFLTGNSGGGRPKGSRNKLGEQLLEALAQDFTEHGQQAIVACREEKPTEYVKVVVSLLPKELLVRTDPVDEMSNEEIVDVLDILRGMVAGGGVRTHEATHKGSGTA